MAFIPEKNAIGANSGYFGGPGRAYGLTPRLWGYGVDIEVLPRPLTSQRLKQLKKTLSTPAGPCDPTAGVALGGPELKGSGTPGP